jgi:hypothetical protein
MRLFVHLILLVNLFLLSSCKNYKPADAAFFLRAGKISVASTANQGSGSHKITDLWLYVNGKFQGSYPVGNLMPIVTKDQSVRINIFAGIKRNGISDTRINWPFYTSLQIDTAVAGGQTVTRDFTFSYIPATSFALIESFDGSGTSFINSSISDTNVVFRTVSGAESFEGKSAMLEIPAGSSIIGRIESAAGYSLPSNSANVYLELNYKGNEEFSVGLLGDYGEIPALVIKPQDNWNKIYVQLSNAASTPPLSSKYKIYIKLLKTDAEAPKIFFDNIKLVYLP